MLIYKALYNTYTYILVVSCTYMVNVNLTNQTPSTKPLLFCIAFTYFRHLIYKGVEHSDSDEDDWSGPEELRRQKDNSHSMYIAKMKYNMLVY